MRKLLSSIAMVLMALVLLAGPTTPAAAASVIIPCEQTADVAASGHIPGDSDEVPSDKDQGSPHHHGLGHGHDVGIALTAYSPVMLRPERRTMRHWDPPTPSSVAPTSDLRPPIA